MDAQQETPQTSIGRQALDEMRGKHAIERLAGVNLDLKLGDALRLRLLCVEKTYEAKVVGLEPFEYLVARLRLPQDTVARLRQNPAVVAQAESSGSLYGFRTEVLNRVTNPAPLVFLSFPSTVERVTLRRGTRIGISIPANIHGLFGEHDVILMDINEDGCRFSARAPLGSPLREAKQGERIVLSCELGATCGKRFMTPMLVRRVNESSGRLTIGCQFVDLTDENSGILNEYMDRLKKLGLG
jgi:c-di-GMP-binding flagellar brake protein YcgR